MVQSAGAFCVHHHAIPWRRTRGMLSKSARTSRMTSDLPKGERPSGPVFVAGASGKVGRRVVRELCLAGVDVRAGARNVSAARDKVNAALMSPPPEKGASVVEMKEPLIKLGDDDQEGRGKITYVDFDLLKPDGFVDAIADASIVVSALGASEGLNLSAVPKIDGYGIKTFMEGAARVPSVKQLVLVSSIGVGKPFAFPAAILNVFGGVLLWKDLSERATRSAARENKKSFLIVRPGGMERPKDDYEKTHNVTLRERGSLSGGQVSSLQVAKLITAAILVPEVAQNKTVEVIAETSASKPDFAKLLDGIKLDVLD